MFADLGVLTLITTCAVVVITSLGTTLQPLTDGALGAGDVVMFAMLACVPMLSYALPFAAGFASTLVYHRIAADNEALAAHAGGVSHRALLAPALAMGILLACGLGLLNERVIPAFLQHMARLITDDLAKVLINDVDRGRPAMIGSDPHRTILYADRAQRVPPDPASGAVDQVLFTGFFVLQLDADHRPVQELSAEFATLWLYPTDILGDKVDDAGRLGRTDDASVAVIQLKNAVGADPSGIGGFREETTFAFRVPNIFRDKPKFLAYTPLRRLHDHPEDMNWVDAERRALAGAMSRVGLMDAIGASIKATGAVTLLDSEGRPVTIRAGGVTPDAAAGGLRLLPTGARNGVLASHIRAGTTGDVVLETLAQDAALSPGEAASGAASLTLELRRARTREVSDGKDFNAYPERTVRTITGLIAPPQLNGSFLGFSAPDLLHQAVTRVPERDDPQVVQRAEALAKSVAFVRRDVLAKSHERFAMAASCMVLVVTGAVVALRRSGSTPLAVYVWTFIPALGSLVTISGGHQMTRTVGAPGLLLLWGGVLVLAVYTLIVYRGLARH